MSLTLYNTLSRKKEPFKPLIKDQVSLYTCGPTVYAQAQIGNLRTYVWQDVLRRWLKYGHKLGVKQVMNITDVEDKIIRDSKAKTVEQMVAFTRKHEDTFWADLEALGVEKAESTPRATGFVPQMISMVKAILKAGYAYERDGSVYFDVQKYHEGYGYGKLINIDFEGFKHGNRIDHDEYDKESACDFALWKAESDDKPGWDSPWGYGRPGWHIECSVMVKEELGTTIDIHGGAVDLIFPHHENEIAQSQAANGKPLSRFWLHGEYLLADGRRMGKSQGNFYTLGDVKVKGFDPLALRMLFISAHYRSKLNFTWESLEAARQAVERIQEFLTRLGEAKPGGTDEPERIAEKLTAAKTRFTEAMDDDLNTPEALAAAYDLIRDLNSCIDTGTLEEGEAGAVRDVFEYFNAVLGVFEPAELEVPDTVQELVEARQAARQSGEFAKSDALRDEIAAAGYSVEDTSQGQRLRKI